MRQTKSPGIVVGNYHHGATGTDYEIRYRKADRKHAAKVGQIEVVADIYDECLAKVKELCEKTKLVVWTPAIEASNSNGSLSLSASRFDLAIREDGKLAICDWDPQFYSGRELQTIQHASLTDKLRAEHSRTHDYQDKTCADNLMAALTEGKPYKVKNDYSHNGARPTVLIWFPYSDNLWSSLTACIEAQKMYSFGVLDALNTPEEYERAVRTGEKVV